MIREEAEEHQGEVGIVGNWKKLTLSGDPLLLCPAHCCHGDQGVHMCVRSEVAHKSSKCFKEKLEINFILNKGSSDF